MPSSAAKLLMLITLSFGMLLNTSEGKAKDPANALEGHWIDSENSMIKMMVKKDNGLLRIISGDKNYGYHLACLVKQMKAICTGDGGFLEGENFLYQSVIEFSSNGTATETWKAFNNLQNAEGKTRWKRN